MNFQKYTIVIATIILVLLLALVGFLIWRAKNNVTWPPIVAECPDYFEVTGPGMCNNVRSLGTCHGEINFTDAAFQGEAGLKNKKKWANKCGVVWDGITNNDSI